MTAHIRSLLGIIGGGASGVLIALAIAGLTTPTTVGVCVAIVAACVIGIYAVKAVEADKRRAADKARHPSQRIGSKCIDIHPSMGRTDVVHHPPAGFRIIKGGK